MMEMVVEQAAATGRRSPEGIGRQGKRRRVGPAEEGDIHIRSTEGVGSSGTAALDEHHGTRPKLNDAVAGAMSMPMPATCSGPAASAPAIPTITTTTTAAPNEPTDSSTAVNPDGFARPALLPGPKPTLEELASTDPDFIRVQKLFKSSWPAQQWPTGKGAPPEVVSVLRVTCNQGLVRGHHQYLTELAGKSATGDPNVVEGWHGARMNCNLGEDGVTATCQDLYCKACLIIKNGVKTKFGLMKDLADQRFGPGVYFSTVSAKSNDYTHNSGCVLLCDVACGKMLEADKSWWGPRPAHTLGYDSVFGVVGKELNYDEFVVYSDHAALPRYFVRFEWPRSRSLVCRPCKGTCWRPSASRWDDGSRSNSRRSSPFPSPNIPKEPRFDQFTLSNHEPVRL